MDLTVPAPKVDLDKLRSQKYVHEYEVSFTLTDCVEGNFLDALLNLDSKELGDQIKKLIKDENGQYTLE